MRSHLLEPELYVEPAQMRPRDVAGVVAALVALAVIGVSGYVWFNPQLSAKSVLALGRKKPEVTEDKAVTSADIEHIDCPYCGMYADTSDCAVATMWQGGGSATFDSFDCVFNYIRENNVRLDSGTVKNYPPGSSPEWIDLKQAFYLYDTTATIGGSMPPYVAAFESKPQAEDSKQELGGSIVNFEQLKGKWKQ